MGIKQKIKKLLVKEKVTPIEIIISDDKQMMGRCALITGGGSGIGFAIAKCFVKSGADVIITGRTEETLIQAQCEINKIRKSSCQYFVLDIRNVDQFEGIISTIVATNRIDILINNAGIRSKTKFNRITVNDFDDVISTNLKGPVFLSQIISRYMIDNSIKGNIVNVLSSSAVRPANNSYTLSKWALRGFTIGMARELIKHNIVVNGVAPGPAATGLLGIDVADPDLSWGTNPSKRLVTPEEIAEITKLLVSSSGRMIVGDIVYVTGGGGITTFDDVK